MKPFKTAAFALLLTLAAGCSEERGADGLTADERERLNEAAANLDAEVIDASPDSLVANEGEMLGEDSVEPAPAGDAAANNLQ